MKISNVLNIFISCILGILLVLYGGFVFVLPKVFNNNVGYFEKILSEKYGVQVVSEDAKISVTPLLKINSVSKKITLYKDDKEFLNIDNLDGEINLLNISKSRIKADLLNTDTNNFFKKNKSKKSSKRKFNFGKLPNISIKTFIANTKYFEIHANDVNLQNGKLTFNATVKNNKTLENHVFGQKGYIYFKNKDVFFKDFEARSGEARLYADGKLTGKDRDFKVYGKSLPVDDIEKTVLFYLKSKDPAKKFMENFYNYRGKADIDLKFTNEGIFGKCTLINISANAVWFDIPVSFREAVFDFNGRTITSVAQGILGGEKAVHTLNITDLGTDKKNVTGTINTTLTEKFRYVTNTRILKNAKAKIVYNINRDIITTDYFLNIDEGSDLFYGNSYLGLRNYKRRFSGQTQKIGNDLKLTKYDYSILKNGHYEKILFGDGLFLKINDNYRPKFITCKTPGYAPVSVTGSFANFLVGGSFKGDIKYDFPKEQFTGNFEIINSRFKRYFIKSAKVTAGENVTVNAEGTYHKEKFKCFVKAKNQTGKELYLYNLEFFLDKFVFKKRPHNKPPVKLEEIKNPEMFSKTKKFTVNTDKDKIKFKINKIVKDKIELENIELTGTLKDEIFSFKISESGFANGVIWGKGKFDFTDNSADIYFEADDINADTVADKMFNLPNSFEGITDAKLHVKTKNFLKDISAKGEFQIQKGYFSKLGDIEFTLKSGRRIKLEDAVNIDLNDKENFGSDINGSFTGKNGQISNLKITSAQKALAILVTGDYNIKTQEANLNIFGKYDKDVSKVIKIFHIPLDFIIKFAMKPEHTREFYKDTLKKLPATDADETNDRFFRAEIRGNLNKKDVKTKLRRIL